MKTEYRKSTGEPHQGAREWSANLQQDRCCEVERRADAIDEGREGARGMEAESENLPMDRVLLSSVSKKDMFRFRRTAARQFQRDVSAKNLIDPVFTVRSAFCRITSPDAVNRLRGQAKPAVHGPV